VHGLTQFQQYVVGDIHHCVDAAHTAAAQFFHHPLRRGSSDIHIADNTPCIAGAVIARFQYNREAILDSRGNGWDRRRPDLNITQNTNFSRQPIDT